MNRNRCREMLILVVLSLPMAGCASWTVLPERTIEGITHETQPTAAAQPTRGIFKPRRMSNPGVQPASHVAPLDPTAPPTLTGATPAKPLLSDDELQRLDPELAMARLAERQGDRNRARRLYENYVQENPSNPLPHHRLGVLASREAKHDQAEQHFRQALAAGPPATKLLSDLGYFYYLQDRLDEAEQVLQQAHAQEPSEKTVCNNLALVYGARGDFREALTYFRKVNDEAKARANLAYVLSQHGKLDAARGEYLAALTMDNKLRRAAKGLLQVDDARKLDQKMSAAAPPQTQHPQDIISREPSTAPKHLERTLRDYTIGNRQSPQPQPARASREPELATSQEPSQGQPQPADASSDEAANPHYANASGRPEQQPVGLFPSLYNRSRPTHPMLEPHAHQQELAGMTKGEGPAPAVDSREATFEPGKPSDSAEQPISLNKPASHPTTAVAKASIEKPTAPPLLNPAAPAAQGKTNAMGLQQPRFATNKVESQGTAATDESNSEKHLPANGQTESLSSSSTAISPPAKRFLTSATPSFLKGFFTKSERNESAAPEAPAEDRPQSPADFESKRMTQHTIVARHKPAEQFFARPTTGTLAANPTELLAEETSEAETAKSQPQPRSRFAHTSGELSGEIKDLDEGFVPPTARDAQEAHQVTSRSENIGRFSTPQESLQGERTRPAASSLEGRNFAPATPAQAPQASRTSRWSAGPAESLSRRSMPRRIRHAPSQPVRLSLSDASDETTPADEPADRTVQPASHYRALPPQRDLDREPERESRPAGSIRLRRSSWSTGDEANDSQLRVIHDDENEPSQPKRFRLSDR